MDCELGRDTNPLDSTGKLSLSMRDQEGKDVSKIDSPRSYNNRRFGGDTSSHGKSNPFNALSPSATKTPSASASSAFGLGSGAFASFGSAKTPKTPGPGSGFDFSSREKNEKKERDSDTPGENSETEPLQGSPGSFRSSSEHPLRNTWNLFYRPPANKFSDYEKSTLKLASISSVENFWTIYSHLKRPSLLPSVSDYHIFKDGIRPVWEDEANKKGGKWIVRLKKGVADRYWEDLLLAIIGDQFLEAGEEVCGAVLSVRSGEDVLSVWTKIDGGRNIKIRETIKRILAFPPDTNIVWKSHDDSIAQRSALDEARQQKIMVVQDTLETLNRTGLTSGHKSHIGQRGTDDKPSTAPLVPPNSNASPSQSKRVQMPRTPPKQLTKTIKAFLGAHDNAACAPIHIESDDDSETPVESKTSTRSSDATLRQSSSWSGLSDNDRLVGGLVRRHPNPERIEEPMKKPFKPPSGVYKPYNTLNGKSAYLHQRTSQSRTPVPASSTNLPSKSDIHANDHFTPHKKRKIGDWGASAISPTSAIPSDGGQILNDSEDELALDTQSNDGNVSGRLPRRRRSDDRDGNGVSTQRHRDSIDRTQVDQVNRSSPQDESAFTKDSAQRRKTEKDKILESPHDLSKHPHTSPYFRYPGTRTADVTRQRQNPKWAQSPESPDALQSTEPQSTPKSYTFGGARYPEMKTMDLGNLIIGHTSSSVGHKRSNETVQPPSKKICFVLLEFVFREFFDSSGYMIELDRSASQIAVNLKDPLLGNESVFLPRGINQIIKLRHGNDESPLVNLQFARTGMEEEPMWLRFESHKMAFDFVKFLTDVEKTLKVTTKDERWMELAFSKAKNACQPKERPSTKTLAMQAPTARPEITSKDTKSTLEPRVSLRRSRLVDMLDAPPEASEGPRIPTVAHSKNSVDDIDRAPPVAKNNSPLAAEESPPFQMSNHSTGMPPPSVTRSRATKTEPSIEKGQSEPVEKTKASQTGVLGRPWTKDLVYPQPGRRAAVVPFDDLQRLDDGQFLNDNLIFFFMRYLETRMEKSNPEVLKRMHFFNTYFYEALSKTKGKRGINYESVSRWTKNINLFSRDFIVVPVNENYHWYLAIICNLPYFRQEQTMNSGWSEDVQLGDQPSEEGEKNSDQQMDDTQRILAKVLRTVEEGDSLFEDRPKFKRRKVVRRSLPKYDVTKPVIITLDSLGSARSETCSQLKQYIVAEARDKRNLDIDLSELKGMTAKEIPTQNNFTDCGLYLCMYLEQFVADPYTFVRRILQREANEQQWPREIRSQDLRSRLRQLILEMHRRQEKEPREMEEPSIGNILINTREISRSPPVTQRTATRHEVKEAKKRFEDITHSKPSESNKGRECVSPELGSNVTKASPGARVISETPEGSDEEDVRTTSKDQMLEQNPRRYSDVEPSSRDTRFRAARLRDTQTTRNVDRSLRSPTAPTDQATYASHPTIEHRSDKRRRLSRADDSDLRRKSRSSSLSSDLTDYLSGPTSAARFLPRIEEHAARFSASLSPHRNVRGDSDEEIGTSKKSGPGNTARIGESHRASPDTEVIGERKAGSGRDVHLLTKRKRPSEKATAPNSTSEHEEWARGDVKRESPRVRRHDFSSAHGDVRSSRQRERKARYGGEDEEMLFHS
ncbi:hypothetical protein AYO20_02540 [Fonsecaea nubica]|uniref:Ubiquitin-like protease family profile domain-containing protein n=1 Tax=Fonsecaea nubica TaxID=856822 RepID=A0A178D7L8_9EURO|nr:hypothetical protein AYO20_02540 [Fonsecaea nubica]OAL38088.1 hypothetical protein AYO20_02540 [Fonsecaea nubica]